MVLIDLVDILFRLLYIALLLRVVLSWVPGALDHPAGYAIDRLTRPMLEPLRRVIPAVGGLDISPFVAFLLLGVAQRIVRETLFRLLF